MVLIIFLLLIVGCSGKGGSSSPIEPDTSGYSPDLAEDLLLGEHFSTGGGRMLFGFWDIAINPDTDDLDVVPLRQGLFHLNILGIVPNENWLTVKFVEKNPSAGKYVIDVTIEHPYPDSMFMGFDVHGIIFGDGTEQMWGKDDPDLMWIGWPGFCLENADGWTRWWNPTEFTTPGLFGYKEGNFGKPGFLTEATLNPYKCFADGLSPTDLVIPGLDLAKHGSLATDGDPVTRRYELRFPMVGGKPDFKFQYAIDASWFPPNPYTGDYPGINDFPISANCPEAFHIRVDPSASTAYYKGPGLSGGDLVLQIEVFDWGADVDVNPQGIDGEIQAISIESQTLFEAPHPVPVDSVPGTSAVSGIYEIVIPVHPTGLDNQQVLVTVESNEPNSYEPPKTDFDYPETEVLSAYTLVTIPVKEDPPPEQGWARTWGGVGVDGAMGVAVDSLSNIYVTGTFEDVVDFDPNLAGTDEHISNGFHDIFLSKFDPLGNMIWARTWGGEKTDIGLGAAVDDADNAYLIGVFQDEVDFDPGPGTNVLESNGGSDIFLSKFDPSGSLIWVRTWGGDPVASVLWEDEIGCEIVLDSSGSVYVTGGFRGEDVDFDPGPGSDLHDSVEYEGVYRTDAFLTKFDSAGSFIWAKSWGGSMYDIGIGATVDEYDNIYITGFFQPTAGWFGVDFDPGPENDYHDTNGWSDAFLSKFDSEGNHLWARTWGGEGGDEFGFGVASDNLGDILVTGHFWGTVDFDPDEGTTDEHYSQGWWDAYLSRFNSDGAFIWAKTWGGTEPDFSRSVSTDASGNIVTSGGFSGLHVDLDPGDGEDIYDSEGELSSLNVSQFEQSGSYCWARIWQNSAFIVEKIRSTVDDSGHIYVPGAFMGTIDFNPDDDATELHTSSGVVDAFLIKLMPDGYW